jgi:hypothetical protein
VVTLRESTRVIVFRATDHDVPLANWRMSPKSTRGIWSTRAFALTILGTRGSPSILCAGAILRQESGPGVILNTDMHMKKLSFTIGLFVITAGASQAQQFQQQAGAIPGPVVWSEAVKPIDADGDTWLDVIISNISGSPTLLMNHGPIGGVPQFVDESAARLPAGFAQAGKGMTVCDIDADGDTDIIFANTSNTLPRILINDGTGHFTDQTAARFPNININAFGVAFGDVDGDGDLDLCFCDASNAQKAHLYINDGTAHFTDQPTWINAVAKSGAQNVAMTDIDNDFDLDIIVDGKSVGTQLYINDGTGHFTFQGATLPGGSSNVYSTEWADLDNDNDIDGFYTSLSGLSEGTAQCNLIPGGTLTYTGTTATLSGHNGDDDNEIVFIDANNDGILDAIDGSLGWSQEKLYLNPGTFAGGSFAYQAAGFTTLTDSTLDLCMGDFDKDGRYDIVTAQGESGGFLNRYYKNTGPIDTVAPRIGRIEGAPVRIPLSQVQAGNVRPRVWIQDATIDGGQTFVTARIDITAVKDASNVAYSDVMKYSGGYLWRDLVQPPSSPTGLVGMDVTYKVHATDPNLNASDSPVQAFKICGAEMYGTASPNSAGPGAHITGQNDPSVSANNFSVMITGLPPNVSGVLFYGTTRLTSPLVFGNGQRWVGGPLKRLPVVFANGSGIAIVNLDFTQNPLNTLVPGDARYFEFQYRDHAAGGANFNGSDALEVVFCD